MSENTTPKYTTVEGCEFLGHFHNNDVYRTPSGSYLALDCDDESQSAVAMAEVLPWLRQQPTIQEAEWFQAIEAAIAFKRIKP